MISEIIDLQQNLYEKNYEYCSKHLNKKHKVVYFAHTMLDRQSILNTFNIWFALNNYSNKFKCIIGGIGSGQDLIDNEPILIPEKYQKGKDSVLPNDENLEWIVLPFVSYDLTETIQSLRANNRGVKIAYQIDFNWFEVAEKNKALAHYSANKDIIKENIRQVDKILFTSEELYNQIGELDLKTGTTGRYLSPLINEEVLNDVEGDREDRKPDEPVRIGVLCTKQNGEDLIALKKVWKAISDKYKEKVIFVLYGDKNNKIKTAFSGVNNEFTQQTGIRTYYTELFNLKLDCVVIPSQSNKWNEAHFDIQRVIELQALGIPVIVSNINPINKWIVDEVTGFLCEDGDRMIRQLEIICEIDNTQESDSIVKRVARTAFNNLLPAKSISKDENIKAIEMLFL